MLWLHFPKEFTICAKKNEKKNEKKKHCDLNFWSIDSPTRKGGLVDMVLVVFILIIDARQAATLPRT